MVRWMRKARYCQGGVMAVAGGERLTIKVRGECINLRPTIYPTFWKEPMRGFVDARRFSSFG